MRSIAVAATTWVLVVASYGRLTQYGGVLWSDTRIYSCDGLVFLSDITRPAFLVDLRAVQRACAIQRPDATTTCDIEESSICIPPILLPQSKNVLVPYPMNGGATSDATTVSPHILDQTLDPVDILHMEGEGSGGDMCFGYIHCQVVKPSQSSNDDTFLCQLNLNSTVFAEENHNTTATFAAPAHLVLGLNNHHVISYYWARSAGSGAAMEAPGVVVVVNKNDTVTPTVQLRWASPEGYTACNSNDGKRSEWVPFLNVNDQVQLRPNNIEMVLRSEALRDNIYGVTMLGRPLGSEPIVVCQWNVSAFV